jgi:hypothetical protein
MPHRFLGGHSSISFRMRVIHRRRHGLAGAFIMVSEEIKISKNCGNNSPKNSPDGTREAFMVLMTVQPSRRLRTPKQTAMKHSNYRNRIHTPILALALATGVATAGTTETTTAPAPAPAEDVISGVLKLDFNTHFISYGADVWGDGSTMSEPEFNPMLELAFALPADFTLTLGTWMDFVPSSKGGDSPIGGRLQEVDVWAGLSYTYEKLTVSATYQSWMYVSDTEDILDIKFAYDCLLSPSLTVHNRLDQGAANGDEGTILVLGLSHSLEAGPVTISFPFNIAYFLTDDFHNSPVAGGSDDGLGFVSVGVAATLPLTPYIGDAYGDWSLNGGLTYYFTDDDVIPNNPQDDLLTASIGLAVSF